MFNNKDNQFFITISTDPNSCFPISINPEKLEAFIKMDKETFLIKFKTWIDNNTKQLSSLNNPIDCLLSDIVKGNCQNITDLLFYVTHTHMFHRQVVDFINNSEISN